MRPPGYIQRGVSQAHPFKSVSLVLEAALFMEHLWPEILPECVRQDREKGGGEGIETESEQY